MLFKLKNNEKMFILKDSMDNNFESLINDYINNIDNIRIKTFGVLSSGSTGTPKLIFRSEESWINAFKYQSELFNLNNGYKTFINGSLSFTANLNYILHILYLGGTIYTTECSFPGKWLDIINNNKIQGIFLVPSKYRLLIKKCNNNIYFVKSVLCAGEKLHLSTAKVLKSIFSEAEVIEYYGTSETSFISYNKYSYSNNYKNSVGKAFPKVNIRIDDENIFVTSPYLANISSKEFKVNDKGYITKEKILVLTGRDNSVINKAGIKVNLFKIQEVIINCSLVEEAVVFSYKDKIKGENIAAKIILKNNNITQYEIKSFLKQRLSSHEIPKIIIVKEIQYNISGKAKLPLELN